VFRRTTETAHLRLHHDDHDYDYDHALQILLELRIPALVHLSSRHHELRDDHDYDYHDHDHALQILLIMRKFLLHSSHHRMP
jgi:hypothetical protein